METIETNVWSAQIPMDWVEIKDDSDFGLNFESADGSKAICIIAEELNSDQSDEIQLKELMEVERTELKELEGYTFKIIKDSIEKTASGFTGYLEAFDQKEAYRLVSKVLVSNAELAQFNFDDYECTDLKLSMEYSTDMIASFKLKR